MPSLWRSVHLFICVPSLPAIIQDLSNFPGYGDWQRTVEKWPGWECECCPYVGGVVELALINLARWCHAADPSTPMRASRHIRLNLGLLVASGSFPGFSSWLQPKLQCRDRLEGVLPTSTATLQPPTPSMESSPRSSRRRAPLPVDADTTTTSLSCHSFLQP